MTRLWSFGASWGTGTPITVTSQPSGDFEATGLEQPVDFTWLGQNHQVAEVTKAWRVDIDWWRNRVWRSYFKLRTETGLLVVIYQDLLSGEWYLQRLYD